MSGPVGTVDAPPTDARASAVKPACVEITPSRESVVGAMRVRRALPRIGRRTVGAWCFADHMGPELVTETQGLDIGPHPHTGLHTVTWLVAGEVLHRDSLGSEQIIRAGQLNLMTAGEGVTHSEEATGRYRGQLHGVQLWVAQPEATRHGPAAFEHHAELPRVELGNAVATVLVGGFAGAVSAARHDTELVGVDAALWPGTGAWPLQPSFEHALVVLDGEVLVGEQVVRPGQLAYLGQGRDQVVLSAADPALVYDHAATNEINLDPDWRGRWAKVTVPTIVCSGDQSFPGLSEAADAVAAALPNASRRILAGQGHRPAPEAMVPVLVEFLRS
jgi:redox-sensitive bicupin YhaK (pirin superfamily)